MQRYDAAIIGGGPEGLVAALSLARAGFSVVVLERKSRTGGRAASDQFHPGFRASPYADELTAISPRLHRLLDLARHGAVLVPSPASVCVSDDGVSMLYADAARTARTVPAESRDGLLKLRGDLERLRRDIDLRSLALAPLLRRSWYEFWKRQPHPASWPGEDWGRESLDEALRARFSDPVLRLHLAAEAASGRAVSFFLAGTALHLMAPGSGLSGTPSGGLGALGAALTSAARSGGAIFRCDADVSDIAVKRGRAVGIALAGGEEIKARVVLSTLDLKRTFFGLIGGSVLSHADRKRIEQFRMAGQRARVLFALDAPPVFAFAQDAPDAALGAIHVAASPQAMNRAHEAWRAGMLDEAPPVSLRVPSIADPRLAPVGKAVMTATVSAVPERLFDGAWTKAKRERVQALALAAAERVAPGVSSRVLAARVIVGSEIETELGLTAGDLDGGEIAPDQIFRFRPPCDWSRGPAAWEDARTPLRGLYLAGPSSAAAPFLLGVSGERAARAILADLKEGRLK